MFASAVYSVVDVRLCMGLCMFGSVYDHMGLCIMESVYV